MAWSCSFDPAAAPEGRWTDYLAGVIRVLHEMRAVPDGGRIAVASAVPAGAGLASSAALAVAAAKALSQLAAPAPFSRGAGRSGVPRRARRGRRPVRADGPDHRGARALARHALLYRDRGGHHAAGAARPAGAAGGNGRGPSAGGWGIQPPPCGMRARRSPRVTLPASTARSLAAVPEAALESLVRADAGLLFRRLRARGAGNGPDPRRGTGADAPAIFRGLASSCWRGTPRSATTSSRRAARPTGWSRARCATVRGGRGSPGQGGAGRWWSWRRRIGSRRLTRALAADFKRETGRAPVMWTARAAGGLRTERGW